MAPEALLLTVPDALAQELKSANQALVIEILERGLQAVKIDRVLERYTRGGLSFGAAAHEAGVSPSELACYAYARGMEPPFSVGTVAEELC
jgi:hypothetical protein